MLSFQHVVLRSFTPSPLATFEIWCVFYVWTSHIASGELGHVTGASSSGCAALEGSAPGSW